MQFTAWSLWAHWSTVGGWGLSQFTVIILWAISIITLIIYNSFFLSPLEGVVPKISCCGSIELSKFKISRTSPFTPSQNFCNLGQSQKMWEKSPIIPQPLQQRGEYSLAYLAITMGVLKNLILSFQLNSLQVGLLKHLCQDTVRTTTLTAGPYSKRRPRQDSLRVTDRFIVVSQATWHTSSNSCSNHTGKHSPTDNKMAPYIGCLVKEGETIPPC